MGTLSEPDDCRGDIVGRRLFWDQNPRKEGRLEKGEKEDMTGNSWAELSQGTAEILGKGLSGGSGEGCINLGIPLKEHTLRRDSQMALQLLNE